MNNTHRLALALVSSLSLAACAPRAVDASDPGTGAQAIVEGEVAVDHPAVVGISMPTSSCSGNLVAPTVVLTAQHCVVDTAARKPPEDVFVTLGLSLDAPDRAVPVREIRLPDERRFTEPMAVPPYGGADFAVLLLAEPVEDVTPLKIRRASLDTIGDTITMVGFGRRDDGGSGERRTREAAVLGADGFLLTTEQRACSGDSGGPALDDDGRIAGVLSLASNTDCNAEALGSNQYSAITRMPGIVDEALRDEGVCDEDAVEVCDSYDNDCDNDIDEGCAQAGDACGDDTQCAGLRECVGGICAVPCAPDGIVDAYDVEATCPDGLVCARSAESCFVGVCVHPGETAEGMACGEDSECASQLCAADADGVSRCRAPCVGEDGACKEGLVCAVDADGCGSCVDDDPLPPSDGGCTSTPSLPMTFALLGLALLRRARQRARASLALVVLAGGALSGASACGEEEPTFEELTPYERPALTRLATDCPLSDELHRETVPFPGEEQQAVLQPFPIDEAATLHSFGLWGIGLIEDRSGGQALGDTCGCVETELVVMVGTIEDGERVPATPRVLETFTYTPPSDCDPRFPFDVTLDDPIALEAGETLFVGARYAVDAATAAMTCFQICDTPLSSTSVVNVELPEGGDISLAYYSDLLLDAWAVIGR